MSTKLGLVDKAKMKRKGTWRGGSYTSRRVTGIIKERIYHKQNVEETEQQRKYAPLNGNHRKGPGAALGC